MMLLPWRGRTNKKAFLERCQRAAAAKFPEAQVAPAGELELDIVFPNGTRNNMYLGRAYAEFARQPRDFDNIMARFLQLVAASADSQPIDPDKLVPMIKDRAWVRSLHDPSGTWVEDYNEQLVVAYAQYKAGFHYCSHTSIDELGIPREELRRRALANLTALSTQREVVEIAGGYTVNVGGNFESSQILLDDLWTDPRLALDQAIVAIPDRDTITIIDDAAPGNVWWLAAVAADLSRSEPFPITSLLFSRRGSGPMLALDAAQEDESHPIARLDVIDVSAIKKDGGADLAIVIATPLDDSARSVFRLFTKIDGYLNHIASEHFRSECGPPSTASTSIRVQIHAGSSRNVFRLLEDVEPWVRKRNARLEVRSGL